MVALTASTLGWIAVGTAAAGAATGIQASIEQRKAGKKSAKLQKEANAVASASAGVEASQRRRKIVAQSRITRAQNSAAGSSMGIAGQSSAIAGANSAVSSGGATNLQNINRTFNTGAQTFGLRQDASDELRRGQNRANNFNALGSVANTASSTALALRPGTTS
jgi:hypothetical protein